MILEVAKLSEKKYFQVDGVKNVIHVCTLPSYLLEAKFF